MGAATSYKSSDTGGCTSACQVGGVAGMMAGRLGVHHHLSSVWRYRNVCCCLLKGWGGGGGRQSRHAPPLVISLVVWECPLPLVKWAGLQGGGWWHGVTLTTHGAGLAGEKMVIPQSPGAQGSRGGGKYVPLVTTDGCWGTHHRLQPAIWT